MPVVRVQRKVNSMHISNKLFSSEVINDYEDVTEDVFNYDTSKETLYGIKIFSDAILVWQLTSSRKYFL